MKNLFFLFLFLCAFPSFAQTVITVSDTIKTDVTWSADTVKVTDNIVVNDGITLTIEAGVCVQVQGQYIINVIGRIVAIGTPENRIKFTALNTTLSGSSGGWGGIRFKYPATIATDTTIFSYCILEYGNGITTTNTYGGAFFVRQTSKIKFINNIVQKSQSNGSNSAVYFQRQTPVFANNLIVDNYGSGIVINECNPTLFNNTFANNGGYGIVLWYGSPFIKNCIVYNNSKGSIYKKATSPTIKYSNIEGENNTTNGNIDQDPLFIGSGQHSYSLKENSPCINSGIPNWSIDSLPYKTDIAGNTRVFEGTHDTIIDMGAYELQGYPYPYLNFNKLPIFSVYFGSTFSQKIFINSYPKTYSTTLINPPVGLTLENDTIKWTPTEAFKGKHAISIKVDNGILTDTLLVTIYVLAENEYYELPDADVTWSADTIKVLNNLSIKNGRTLTINPGVCVQFQGHYKLDIKGRILAQGAAENRINFTCIDTILTSSGGGWGGIRFSSTPTTNDTSKIEFCTLKYANGWGSYPNYNGGALYISNYDKVQIVNNLIAKCRASSQNYAIYIEYSSCLIQGNAIVNNYGGGIYIWHYSSPKIINNTIANNTGYGIRFSYSDAIVSNNIITNNSSANLYQYNSNLQLKYNNIGGANITTNGNIDHDPLFLGSGNHPYSLQANSLCVNTGIPNWTLDSIIRQTDISGNTRIFEGSNDTIIDMGAYELQADPAPYLIIPSFDTKFIRFDSLSADKLNIISYPKNLNYTFVNQPSGMVIENDSIKWTPNSSQSSTYYTAEIIVDNSKLTDTITVEYYVLAENEYYELPDADVTWSADTIKVLNNLSIKNGRTLTINPGVCVQFQGHYKLDIKGRILAQGAAENRINFTCIDTVLTSSEGGWGGIRFYSTPTTNDTSKIEFCSLKYANGWGSSPNYNGGALYIYNYNKVQIVNNLITKCRASNWNYAIYTEYSSCLIQGNVIVNNYGGGIFTDDDYPKIINNTIANNSGYGIRFYYSDAIVSNNIITNNSSANIYKSGSNPQFAYNNIGGANLATNGNIDQDPLFLGSGNHPYSLQANSLCVNTGIPNWTLDSIIRQTDISGNTRIFEGSNDTIIDMGAYELQADPAPYLIIPSFDTKFIRFDSLSADKLNIISYPKNLNYTFVNQPSGMVIENDSIKWTPNSSQSSTYYTAEIIVDNSKLTDTITVEYYVLAENEYYELPDADVTWSADTIKVLNNLSIKNGRTLTINPGVCVQFQGHYKLDIKGRILAQGAAENRINFTCIDTVLTSSEGGWGGIRFYSTPTINDTSKIEFCSLKYANGWGSSPNYNGGALYIYRYNKVQIVNNLITKCRASNRNYAIYTEYSSCLIQGNVIVNNYGGGIYTYNDSPRIINNTIANNEGYGVWFSHSDAIVSNNIITNNWYASIYMSSSNPQLVCNNIGGANITTNGNIDQDPLFIGSGKHSYQLKGSSPCINSGDSNFITNGKDSIDFTGNTRILLDEIDIGAYEYNGPTLYFEDKVSSVDENITGGYLIDSVKAYYLLTGTPMTTIISGNENNIITYNSTSGYLYVNDSSLFNHELNDSIHLKFKTTVGSLSDTADVIIVINDINETPSLDTMVFEIFENMPNNTVIDTVVAYDEDIDSKLRYSIYKTSQLLSINDSTGVITIKDSTAFNYEINDTISAVINVSDGNNIKYAPVYVVIKNINEPCEITSNYNIYINENLPMDATVYDFTSNAYDTDGDALNYEIILGNTDNAFAISNSLNNIIVANPSAIDYETNRTFALQVVATDGEFYDTATFQITLYDVDETGLNPFQGFARSHAVSFTIKDTAYIGLGQNADIVLNDFWSYNKTDDEWQQAEPFPGIARIAAVSFVIDNKAYVGLGYNQVSNTLCNDFYEYSPATNTWKQIADFAGSARYEAVAFAIGDTAYVGTGRDATDNTNDFWKYTATSNEWTKIEGFTGGKRSGAVAFTIKGKAYVSGGADYSTSLSDVQEYDPTTNTWTEKVFADGLNLAFEGATAIADDNKALICYGNQDKVVSYTPSTNQVSNLGDVLNLGTERFSPISFALGDSAYFGLGYYYENGWDEVFSNEISAISKLSWSPSNVELSNNSIDENKGTNSLVGALSAMDKNINDAHAFELVSGDGDSDNNLFSITNNELLASTLNYEEKSSFSIRVKTSDGDNNTFEKAIDVFALDVNETPTEILLDRNSFIENNIVDEQKATLTTNDEDTEDNHSYKLLVGDNDNSFFRLESNYIYPKVSFSYEEKDSYKLEVKSTDAGGLSLTKSFEIYIEDINDAPSSIYISHDKVFTDDAIGTTIGVLKAVDEDAEDSHTFELTSNTEVTFDDAQFYSIADSILLLAKKVTTDKQLHELIIKVTDKGDLTNEQYIAISVIDGIRVEVLQEASTAFNIYPNPSNGLLSIKHNNSSVISKQIRILNSKGSLLKTIDNASEVSQLDISEFKQGMYFIVIETDKGLYYKKIVLE